MKKIVVGKITGAHGVHGYVKVLSFTEDPAHLFSLEPFFIDDRQVGKWPSVKKTSHPDLFLVGLFSTREEALLKKGQLISVWRSQLPLPQEGEMYYIDLIGKDAYDAEGKLVGKVTFVHNFGAGDILEIQQDSQSSMISFRDIVQVTEEGIHLGIPASLL